MNYVSEVMKVLSTAVFLAIALLFTGVNGEEDYIILLDSSESFISLNFESEIRFSVNLVKKLFSNDNRIGLFTFGEHTHNQFTLDQYDDLHQLDDAITYMWYSTGNGNVKSAMEEVLEKGFAVDNGDRDCTANVLIVLTHSAITDSSAASHMMEELDNKAIRIFILNMAGENASPMFADITNSTDRVLNISDFSSLESSVSDLYNKIMADIPRTGCGVLTQWQPWTGCSQSCNSGLRLRTRQCQRLSEMDRDCNGDLSETEDCYIKACTDPLDGGWTNWMGWGDCSKTCGTGSQSRSRECKAPIPRNGGKPCPGVNVQGRDCSEWKCPDCTKRCPAGSKLSSDCALCICSNITLYGRVMDDTRRPVKNGSVFLNSRRYKAVASTNDFGFFKASGICIINETITIQASGRSTIKVTPLEVNLTHWLVNTTLTTLASPVYTMQPNDKIRMVGQSLTLCCSAVGKPNPQSYKWYKEGIELENTGMNGTLTLTSLTLDDAATYKCFTETEAGVSLSDEAVIVVKERKTDTCGNPQTSMYDLPYGCYQTGDTTQSSSVDVGTCGKAPCVSDSLRDNGTCADWWSFHCCDVDVSEEIEIICNGFSYSITRIRSCKCKPCVFKTSISGRVNGIQNGSLVPLRLGTVITNGKEVARTNMAGFFRFDVPKGTKRIVATFHDEYFKKFLDTTKTIMVNEGMETYIAVKVPLKPVPIPFNPKIGTSFNLGDPDLLPAGSISIPDNSLVDHEGNPFNGPAEASIHFMDPRNMDNLEFANGEFVTELPNGEKNPLQTFGIFNIGLRDDNGNAIQINKPMKFKMDASMFNATLYENGDSDLALWNFDVNKGIWVEGAKLRYESSSTAGRHLLQASERYGGEIEPTKFQPLDQFGTHIEVQRISSYIINIDHPVTIYKNITVRDTNPRDGACFISVAVYEDLTLRKPYTKNDVTVKVFTTEKSGTTIGFSDGRLVEGHACIPTFCNKIVYIRVENKAGERLYPGQHFLPPPYPVISTAHSEVKIESRYFGDAIDCTGLSKACSGPIYQYDKRASCANAKYNDDSFQFKFAPFTSPPIVSFNPNDYDKKLSWYPVTPDKATFRSCFMKVRIKIEQHYQLRLLGVSYLNRQINETFGLYDVGFEADPMKNDATVRGACMEFRCPGYIKDGDKESFDQPTIIEAWLSTNQSLKCSMQTIRPDLVINAITDAGRGDVGFSFRAEAGRNYGPAYGIYVNDKGSTEVEHYCNSGADTGPEVDGLMDPTKNAALEFNCL